MLVLLALLQCTPPTPNFQLDVPDRDLDEMLAAPDLDGDGRNDFVLFGPPGAHAYSGATGALLGVGYWALNPSYNAAFVGDASGDGVPDIGFIQAGTLQVFRYNSATPVYSVALSSPEAFVVFMPMVGRTDDLDQDGVDDIWVRVVSGPTGQDSSLEFHSTVDGSLIGGLSSPTAGLEFGRFVAVLDDLDGDGVGELAISEFGASAAWPGTVGRVYIMSPVTGVTLQTIPSPVGALTFGDTVHAVGDIDRDGLVDLAVARTDLNDNCHLDVHSSATGAWISTMSEPERSTATALPRNFGRSVGVVGDLNFDSVPDLVVTSPRTACGGVNGGAAYLFSGATGALLDTAFRNNGGYARQVAPVGDLDGDGRAEWAVLSANLPGNPDAVRVEWLDYEPGMTVIDWERSGDGTVAIENGRSLEEAGLLEPFLRVTAAAPGALGVAAFDSDPAGPNALGGATNLLVDRGNVLVLQDDLTQTVPGVYDAPGPAPNGGAVYLELLVPALPVSLELVGLGAATAARVTIRDAVGEGRTFHVPPGFTADGGGSSVSSVRALRLDTLADQAGHAAVATATQDAQFDPSRAELIEVWMDGPGAIDRLVLDGVPPRSYNGFAFVGDVDVRGNAYPRGGIGLGDLNGDGRSEFALSVYADTPGISPFIQINDGATGEVLREIPAVQGRAMDSLPGSSRLLAGNFRGSSAVPGPGCGLVYIYDPSTGQRLLRVTGPTAGARLGVHVTFLDDVDGDGVEDFAAMSRGGVDASVHVISGATGVFLHTIDFTGGLGYTDWQLTRGDDIDGDGLDDILVSFPSTISTTLGWVVRAYSSVTGATLFERAGGTDGLYLFSPVGRMDDRNGDGVDDILTISFGQTYQDPLMLVLLSGADGSLLEHRATHLDVGSPVPIHCFPGDVTGDAIPDLAFIGWPGPDATLYLVSGGTLELVAEAELGSINYGIGLVSPAGDVNGDGNAELTLFTDVSDVFQWRYQRPLDELICRGRPHSEGVGAELYVTGSVSVADDAFELTLRRSPASSFALLLNASAAVKPFGPGAVPLLSDGRLCLSPASLARHPVLYPIVAGSSSMPVGLGALPTANVPGFSQAAMVGETRLFQCWFRDLNGVAGSNLSDAIAVTFE